MIIVPFCVFALKEVERNVPTLLESHPNNKSSSLAAADRTTKRYINIKSILL